uniref:Plastocyanin-like domain-containing protein n=1 Tax=Manihot esculenta TaxID=3983 RepID=A0A2C9W6G8_MANES
MPDGVLINGKSPCQYNTTLVPDGIDYETIEVHPAGMLPEPFNAGHFLTIQIRHMHALLVVHYHFDCTVL